MPETGKQRKKDRRTLYTQTLIKETLLEMTRELSYEKINVTCLCQRADISRSTFYLHFDSIDDVLDQVIDDALLFSDEINGTIVDMLNAVSEGDLKALRENEMIMPACQRIADSERYHHLFMDAMISEHIIQRIGRHEKEHVVRALFEYYGIDEADAAVLFRFMLYGSFAVNRNLNWKKDERWYDIQAKLARFLNGGMKALQVR